MVAVAAIAALAIAAGCGGGGDGEEALTKAQYVEKSHDVCGRAIDKRDVLLEDAFDLVEKEGFKGITELSKPAQERLVLSIALPPIQEGIENLAKLPPPEGDEDTVDAFVEGLEAAVKKTEEDPSAVLGSPTPFDKPMREAAKYGLDRCSELA